MINTVSNLPKARASRSSTFSVPSCALFYGIFSGVLAAYTPLHPLSLAMAAGVGSGSMMTAAIGPLIASFPELETQIVAFAGASNLLTYATGLFVSIFIALPITEKLYNLFWKWRGGEKS